MEEANDLGDESEAGADLELEDEDDDGDVRDGRRGVPLNDSIETESDDATPELDEAMDYSQEHSEEETRDDDVLEPAEPSIEWEERSPIEERQPKRRRVTISPDQDLNPLNEDEEEDDDELANSEADPPSSAHTPIHDTIESIPDMHPTQADSKPLQQPIFQAAPRFKPTEADPTTDGLPAAFLSPQRRGQKYIPHGLAAALQGWLSDVKGWEGGDGASEAVLTLAVDEVRPGRRMYLVRGRVDGGREGRFMLAGEGRLTGLGRRAVVQVGGRVRVGRPVWDVVLEGETWTVACDWGVV